MQRLRIVLVVVLVYAGLVAVFESMLGVAQPANESTLVITTVDAEGRPSERVLSRLESDGQLYVAANHWPRRWYRQALAHPEVQIAMGGETRAYRAVPVDRAEHERVHREHAPGVGFRVAVGFAPRRILRLEPLTPTPPDAMSAPDDASADSPDR